MSNRRHMLAALGLLLGLAEASAAPQAPTDDPQASPVWQQLRGQLFGARPIEIATAEQLRLEVPGRAIDAAVVPVAIHAQGLESGGRRVRRLVLIIDANPAPVAAIVDLAAPGGRPDLETRVRVDQYSFVRAIAETDDGRLYAAVRFVKASGGCSAPPGTDAATARAHLGRMSFRVDEHPADGTPVRAQLLVQHPNDSGLAMDPLTRQYAPPYFLRRVEVRYGAQMVFSADVNFSLSENPSFAFYFQPQPGSGLLQAQVVDSQGGRYAATQAVGDGPR